MLKAYKLVTISLTACILGSWLFTASAIAATTDTITIDGSPIGSTEAVIVSINAAGDTIYINETQEAMASSWTLDSINDIIMEIVDGNVVIKKGGTPINGTGFTIDSADGLEFVLLSSNIDTTGSVVIDANGYLVITDVANSITAKGDLTNNGTIISNITSNLYIASEESAWNNTGSINITADIATSLSDYITLAGYTSWENSGTIDMVISGSSVWVSLKANANNNSNWINHETGVITITDEDKANRIDMISHGDLINKGEIHITTRTLYLFAEYNWINEGLITLDTTNYAEIGSYDDNSVNLNKGIINVQGVTKLWISEADIPLVNYNTINFTDTATFYNSTSRIINGRGPIKDTNVDYDTIANTQETAALYDLKANSGITDFQILNDGEVTDTTTAGDILDRIEEDWLVNADELLALGQNTALFIPNTLNIDEQRPVVIANLPDAGELKASLYSIKGNETSGDRPTVDATITLTKDTTGDLKLTGNNSWYNGVVELNDGSFTLEQGNNLFGGKIVMANNTSIIFGDNGYYSATVQDLVSNGGVIELKVHIDSATPEADQLVIANSVTGTTAIKINYTNGDGALNDTGLCLVSINSSIANVAKNAFVLQGGVLDNGAYNYSLYKNEAGDPDPNSFYLKQTRALTGNFKAMTNMPTITLLMVNTGMDSLHKRLGDLRFSPGAYTAEGKKLYDLWVRTYGKTARAKDGVTTDVNILGFEMGADVRLNWNSDTIYLGVMAGYMDASSVKAKVHGRKSGSGSGYAPSVGVYGTWLNKNGFYVDAVLRSYWTRFDLKQYTAAGDVLKYKPNRQTTAASVEAGKAIKFEDASLEPNARLSYAYTGTDSLNVSNGYNLKYSETESLNLRVGAKLNYEGFESFKPFINAGVSYEFKGKTDVKYADGKYESDLRGVGGDIGVGFDCALSENLNLHGEFTYEKARNYDAVGVNLGLRVTF